MAMADSRAVQINDGNASALADAELEPLRLVCEGSDADHVKYPAAVTDRPKGVTSDGCDAAEDLVQFDMLGRGRDTKVVKFSGSAAKGYPVCPAVDGTGKARAVPATPGAYYFMGRLLEAATDGQEVGIDDERPRIVGAYDADSDTFGVPAFAADMATPVEGGIWYDTVLDKYRVKNGTSAATVQVVEE
jgi:hypothetical protein